MSTKRKFDALGYKQINFPFHAGGETHECAIGTHDTVTGND